MGPLAGGTTTTGGCSGPAFVAFVTLAGGTELCGQKFGSTAPMLAFMDVGRVVKR
jgi:hypothetical protein